MATDFSHIELNDRQRHLLASAADHLGLPWTEVFENVIAPLAESPAKSGEENGKAETPFEILARHGLIGCITGTPPDLSTNKKYLAGYGKHG
jgi:ABC-type nitrate/sulfonate/bicarbonate transport system ATPase subunit